MIDLVLVHAYPFDARMWAPQLHAAPQGMRVHTPEMPGFGQAADREGCDSVDGMAQALRRWVHSRGLDRFVLGGLSMGGYVALSYWRQFETDGQVRGLVLADTRAEADTPEGRRTRDENSRLVRERGVEALVDRLLPRMLSPRAPKALQDEVRAIMASQPADTVLCASEALRDRPDATAMLHTIDVPTLVVGGSDDQLIAPEVMQRLAQAIRTSEWVLLPDAGHISNLEQPQHFNRAVFDFAFRCEDCSIEMTL